MGDRVKRKPFISALLAAFVLVAPTLVVAEDPPVPLPRRAERMPAGAEATPTEPATTTTTATTPAADSAVEAAAQVAKPVGKPQDVTLVAKVTEDGQDIPDGLTWRVFETRTDASGELALAGKSEKAKADFKLVPGSYVVHVAYGRAQTTETITVSDSGGADANSKELVLDAGAIRLNAAVTGDVPIPINLQRFDIFSGTTDADRQPVAQSLGPNDVVTLNAGTYHVVSYFGDVNAVVRADLRVEPGQMTDATLYHKAAQVSFKLVSEAGGEAIADIDWTVKSADGEQIFTATGAFPAAVLAEGEYQVFAKRGDQVYNRAFEVQAGPAKEIEVLTTVYNQTGT